MNGPGSGSRSSESAASRRPAAQPSVRACSTSIWAAPRSASPRSSAHSSRVNARSAARISVRPPLSRTRCRPSSGSARVATMKRIEHGACESSVSSSRRTIGLSSSWTSSSTSTTGVVRSPSRSASRTTGSSVPESAVSAPLRSSASSIPSQSCGLQLSSRSNVNHATSSRSRAHEARSTDFPVPACAERSVTGPSTPVDTRSSSRGRGTYPLGSAGAVSFVERMAFGVLRWAASPRCGVSARVTDWLRSSGRDKRLARAG